MSYRNTLLAWFAAILVVLAAVGSLAYRSITGLVADSRWVAHTHEVLGSLNGAMALIAEAESSQRGYVITGRADYLGQYHAARPLLEAELRRLDALVADNPEQNARAQRLARLVATRLEVMQRVVEDREQDFATAQRRILTNEGRQVMVQVRQLVDEMLAAERGLLERRSELAAQAAQRTLLAGGGGLALALAIMFVLLQAIRRENLRRAAVEARLQDNNQDLALTLEHVRKLGSELSTLSTMGELLHSCRSVEEARPVITRSLQQLLPGSAGAISLLNASQNLMETAIEWSAADGRAAATEPTFAPDQCWALRRGRPHAVTGAQGGQLCGHLQGAPPPAYACLPMMAQGEAIGAMYVQCAADEERLRLLRTVSEQLALALANLKLQESLRIQSIRDPLTGLFNRRYLEASLERELSRARRGKHPVCVLMLDVDHFKRFNDTFGHEAGDTVLVQFAGVLKAATREDDIASRYGGEEFTLVLPDSPVEVARERAETIRAEVKKLRLEHHRRPLGTITVSLGLAVFPQDGATPSALIQAADAALYQAKQAGRDRVVLAAEVPRPA